MILNCVAERIFAPTGRVSVASDRPIVLCVASLIAYKGRRVLLDAARAAALDAAARKRALCEFSTATMVGGHVDLYASLLG